jgi:hypothetical protein
MHILFRTIESIAPDPELRTGRGDKETQPATIGHLVLFGHGLCVLDLLDG